MVDKEELINKFFDLVDKLVDTGNSPIEIGKDWRRELSRDSRFTGLLDAALGGDRADLASIFEFGYVLAKLESEEQSKIKQ